MGIFFTRNQAVAPTIQAALTEALTADPATLGGPQGVATQAAARTQQVAQATAPAFNLRNFILAVLIAAILLALAIYLDNDAHKDISKALMTSFSSYSGIVIGLLGGEVQKSAS
jgi:hypothetical protein